MNIRGKIKAYRQNKYIQTIVNTLVGFVINYVGALAKIIMGIFTMSMLLAISGIYTVMIGIVKNIVFFSYQKIDEEKEHICLIAIGVLIMCSALAFLIYTLFAFYFYHAIYNYHYIMSIAIAGISFYELIMSFINFAKSRKSQDHLMTGLRCGNIASGFYAIVITQIALLAVYDKRNTTWAYNLLTGTIASILAGLVGIWLIRFAINTYKKKNKKLDIQQ